MLLKLFTRHAHPHFSLSMHDFHCPHPIVHVAQTEHAHQCEHKGRLDGCRLVRTHIAGVKTKEVVADHVSVVPQIDESPAHSVAQSVHKSVSQQTAEEEYRRPHHKHGHCAAQPSRG